MFSLFSRMALAVTAVVATAAPTYAGILDWFFRPAPRPTPTPVPEIDASSGLLAVAAVLAVLALVAERRRKAR